MAPTAKKPVKSAAPASKTVPTKEAALKRGSIRPPPGRPRKVDKSKMKGKSPRHKLKLKGWLATPADWARFNAWAKIHAQPKKHIEPPPIVRPTKPLPQLKKRIKMLSTPRKAPDPYTLCRVDFTISKMALKATASKRTILLSLPNLRLTDYGRVYYKVSPAALAYEPSPRMLELSQPKALILPEECKPPRLSMCERRGVDEERLRRLALHKKMLACPQQLTPEEVAELFTPGGVRRTALRYKITPWMTYLSLPMYKRLKERKDQKAITWKKTLIEEGEKRGKEAMEEFERKQEEKRMARKRKYEDSEAGGDTAEEEEEKDDDDDEEAETAEETEKKAEKAKRRKMEKHAWRFAPPPYKADPYGVKKGTIEASPRTKTLAQHRERKDKVTKPNAFSVRKGALTATASGRIESLAKPPRPRSPIEKKPPRKKDKYGRPIFQIPVYEKVLPKTKPYQMGKCPDRKEAEEKKTAKKRPIDPIVYEATIDPCIYPQLAKRQKLERKRAEKLSTRRKGRRRRQQKVAKKMEAPAEPAKVEAEEEPPAVEEAAEEAEAVEAEE